MVPRESLQAAYRRLGLHIGSAVFSRQHEDGSDAVDELAKLANEHGPTAVRLPLDRTLAPRRSSKELAGGIASGNPTEISRD
jgi:hypothetical protein